MSANDYSRLEWLEYLELVEKRHGKDAREVAERHGSALAGDAAAIRGRQRMSWRSRLMHRRRRS